MCAPRCILISPHLDDAVISVGGHLIHWRKRGIFVTVYDFFSVSNFTRWGFGDQTEVTATRKREERLVLEELGVDFVFLGYEESVVRGHRIEDEAVGYPIVFQPALDQPVVSRAIGDLRGILSRHPDCETLFPAAIGDHIDHVCLQRAACCAIAELPNLRFGFYEDLPYCQGREFPALIKQRYDLRPRALTIDLEAKLSCIRRYASQPTDEWIGAIAEHARQVGTGTAMERVWTRESSYPAVGC